MTLATGSRKPRGWSNADADGLFPNRQSTVWEKEPSDKPVLFGARGEPLVKKKEPLGFRPPEKRS